MAIKVSVVIVTFYREQLVRRTLLSCLQQRDIDFAEFEIITVDGSPDESARPVFEEVGVEARKRGLTWRYLHEPRPGISHSRNAGVLAAAADLVAFIDDDEEAEPHWLSRLVACQARFGADVVVGPVYPIFEIERASRDPFWQWYFTADCRQPSGDVAKRGAGTHNCLLVKRTCCVDDEPFDPALGLTGGEDTRFFQAVSDRGGKVVWCADAIINEFIPASRSNWPYALRRRIRENQLLMQLFLSSKPPQFSHVFFWMGVGLAQIIMFLPVALLVTAFDRSIAKKCTVKVAGGIGKLFWFPAFTLIGYGDRSAKPPGDTEAKDERNELAVNMR